MADLLDIDKPFRTGATAIHPVVLTGSGGQNLWPLARESHPKPLLMLRSTRSMLQETLARTTGDAMFANPIVICSDDLRFMVDEQLRQVSVRPQRILVEPSARNTAPAIVIAGLWLAQTDPDALILIEPSDHVIGSVGNYHQAIGKGIGAAHAGYFVAFGSKPNGTEDHFDYIQAGTALPDWDHGRTIEQFVERPNSAKARSFARNGTYYRNCGIYLVAVRHLIEEFRRLHPAIVDICAATLAQVRDDSNFLRFDSAAFGELPFLSFTRAFMERTPRAVMISADMEWTDVGSWNTLRNIEQPDSVGNVSRGDVVLHDVKNSYIRSEGRLIAAVGVENTIIVSTDDAVLVAKSSSAQEVSTLVEQLRLQNRPEPTTHKTVQRPWGSYRSVDEGDRYQVKHIMVKPGAQLSLQKHFHRAEHWVVVRGTALVRRGDESQILRENESIYIPAGAVHQLANPGKLDLHLIEVQSGPYLGEDDIVRLADSYGRA
jgi:mannose-1-phosphate guanylyltransferase / mannose-6-phosphate isomerase